MCTGGVETGAIGAVSTHQRSVEEMNQPVALVLPVQEVAQWQTNQPN